MGKRAPTIPRYSNSQKCDSLAKYQEIYFQSFKFLQNMDIYRKPALPHPFCLSIFPSSTRFVNIVKIDLIFTH